MAAAAAVKAIALAAALAFGLAACGGGSGKPKRTLVPGTLTLGAVVVSARDRLIASGARIEAAEVNDAGGILGKVRLRLVAGPDAAALVRSGARALLLPCAARDQAQAESAVRGRSAVLFATCAERPSRRAWGVGPSVADRAAALAGWLHDQGVRRVMVLPGGAAGVLRRAVAAWGIHVGGARSQAVLADRDWSAVRALRHPVDGLDSLDSAAGMHAAGAVANGTTFATFGFPAPGTLLDEVYERYRLDHGHRPDGSAIQLGFDGVRVVVRAVEMAQATAPGAIAAALPGLSVSGAGGVLDYASNGARQPRADAAVVQVRDGRLDIVAGGRPERRH